MTKHFDNREAAILDLMEHGFRELANGRWISPDKSCRAQILLTPKIPVVAVQYWEIR